MNPGIESSAKNFGLEGVPRIARPLIEPATNEFIAQAMIKLGKLGTIKVGYSGPQQTALDGWEQDDGGGKVTRIQPSLPLQRIAA